ncbi:MAG: recombinase family protein [Oscillospiraceae bacterium]|nr:recombinase family protein [Oscillospiraceae bacterium]
MEGLKTQGYQAKAPSAGVTAATYIRVANAAKDGINGGGAPKRQREELQAYADRFGIEIKGEFVGIGSDQKERRPGVDKMIRCLKDGQIDALLVKTVGSLGYGTDTAHDFMAAVEETGTVVKSLEEGELHSAFMTARLASRFGDFFPS